MKKTESLHTTMKLEEGVERHLKVDGDLRRVMAYLIDVRNELATELTCHSLGHDGLSKCLECVTTRETRFEGKYKPVEEQALGVEVEVERQTSRMSASEGKFSYATFILAVADGKAAKQREDVKRLQDHLAELETIPTPEVEMVPPLFPGVDLVGLMARFSKARGALVIHAKEVHRLLVRLQAKDPLVVPFCKTVMELSKDFASQMALLDIVVFQYHHTLAPHAVMHGMPSVLVGGASLDGFGGAVSSVVLGCLQGGGDALMWKACALVAYVDTPSLDARQSLDDLVQAGVTSFLYHAPS